MSLATANNWSLEERASVMTDYRFVMGYRCRRRNYGERLTHWSFYFTFP